MAFCTFGREYEHSDPQYFIEKAIDSTASKIGFKLKQGDVEEIIKQEWDKLNDKLEKEKCPLTSLDEFSLKVFKKITADFGGLANEKLEEEFRGIIIEKQVQKTIEEIGPEPKEEEVEDEEIYEALGKIGVQAKQEGFDITQEMAEEIKTRVKKYFSKEKKQ